MISFKNFTAACGTIVVALCIAACGDSSSVNGGCACKTAAELESEADFSIESFDDMLNCNDNREGKSVYVKDEKILYVCRNGGWGVDEIADDDETENDGKKENDKRKGKSSSVDKDKSSSSRPASSSESLKSSSSQKRSSSSESPIESDEKFVFEGNDDSKYDAEANTLTDLRDGQTYRTVVIEDQVWMAENLNFAYEKLDDRLDTASYCYDKDPANCEKYGRLYSWNASIDKFALFSEDGTRATSFYTHNVKMRGVCPKGWRLPNYNEWRDLFYFVGGYKIAGGKLKSKEGWEEDSYGKSGNGTDDFGFSVFPGGWGEKESSRRDCF